MPDFPRPSIGWPAFAFHCGLALLALALLFTLVPANSTPVALVIGFAIGLVAVRIARFR